MGEDVQNWITAACAVATLLLAGAGALIKVCRDQRANRQATAADLAGIREQNVVQSTQIAALTAAVQQLQQWAMGGKDGR